MVSRSAGDTPQSHPLELIIGQRSPRACAVVAPADVATRTKQALTQRGSSGFPAGDGVEGVDSAAIEAADAVGDRGLPVALRSATADDGVGVGVRRSSPLLVASAVITISPTASTEAQPIQTRLVMREGVADFTMRSFPIQSRPSPASRAPIPRTGRTLPTASRSRGPAPMIRRGASSWFSGCGSIVRAGVRHPTARDTSWHCMHNGRTRRRQSRHGTRGYGAEDGGRALANPRWFALAVVTDGGSAAGVVPPRFVRRPESG